MASTSRVTCMLRERLSALACALGAACSPLTATIGYDEPGERDASPEPTDDAGDLPSPDADAAGPGLSDGGGLLDATPSEDQDARAPVRCWHLPDVVNPRNEAGIERVEQGDVFGATDKELGCLDGGVPPATPVPVTYERNDGMPLLRAGGRYSATIPNSIWVSVNAYAADRCQQTAIPMILAFSSLTGRACADINPLFDARALRLILSNPTELPMGLTLCDANCSGLPP